LPIVRSRAEIQISSLPPNANDIVIGAIIAQAKTKNNEQFFIPFYNSGAFATEHFTLNTDY
jgi:hypothetical protein